MGVTVIETESERLRREGISQGISQGINQGINETKKKTALRMLKIGKLTMEEIAEYTELKIEEVEQLAKFHTV